MKHSFPAARAPCGRALRRGPRRGVRIVAARLAFEVALAVAPRRLDADVAAKILDAVLRHPRVKRFLSDEPFTVDGTLIEAWASIKSVRARDGSDEPPGPVAVLGERRVAPHRIVDAETHKPAEQQV